MIIALKKAFGETLDKMGLMDNVVHWMQRRHPESLTVLMYHRILTEKHPLRSGCLVSVFEKQMAYIAEFWTPVSEQQVVDFYTRNEPLPPGAVLVTFDDGYKDVFTHAMPVLKKYGIPAISFVSSEPVINRDPLWTDELMLLFKHTSETEVTVTIDGRDMKYDLSTTEKRATSMVELKAELKKVSNTNRIALMEGISKDLGGLTAELCENLLVTEQDLEAMHKSGFQIGGHTATHPILSKVDADTTRDEVRASRDYLLGRGYPQNSFCYPNGERADYTEETIKVVQELGYKVAFTTEQGCNGAESDPFQLSRWHVSNLPISALKFRLAAGLRKKSISRK